ncbi:isoprenoid synthase domain-containing protein [Poronia punctata]|nr:isoprenoid synthase domain-containing protein [Poronia punctata]
MHERALLASKLTGQRLIIPSMRPIFSHWPSGQNVDYEVIRTAVNNRIASFPNGEYRKAIYDANPALLAARWWPTAPSKPYQTMTDLIIWFGLWDDVIEQQNMIHDDPIITATAENLRSSTKDFIRRSLMNFLEDGTQREEAEVEEEVVVDPVTLGFLPIAVEARGFYSREKLTILLDNFTRYIDSTRLEAEMELRNDVPSLKEYWEMRILTSGMGTLLGLSEYALQVQLPLEFIKSEEYSTLWVTTIIINSM